MVELTPEREYLLVTEFFEGATERGEAQVDDQVMDSGLQIIRKLWEAGLALPSQLRRLLRAQGRDLHAEFTRLLPTRPQPIPIQRWSARRVGLLGLVAALVVVIGVPILTWMLNNDVAVKTPLGTRLQVHSLDLARARSEPTTGSSCGANPPRG